MKARTNLILLACATAFGGGSAFSQPYDAGVARLAKVAYLSEADLLSDEGSAQFQAARRLVRTSQCAAQTPNPLIYVTLPAAPGARTGSDLPLRVSSVANFPNEYLRDMSALVQSPGVPPEVAQKLRGEIQPNYEKLSARVRLLIGEFDPRACLRPAVARERWAEIIDLPVNP